MGKIHVQSSLDGRDGRILVRLGPGKIYKEFFSVSYIVWGQNGRIEGEHGRQTRVFYAFLPKINNSFLPSRK